MNTEDEMRDALRAAVDGVEASTHLWGDIERSKNQHRRSPRPLAALVVVIAMLVAASGLVWAGRDTGGQQLRVTSAGSGLVRPRALAVAADGSLLIADQGRNQILRRSVGGELVPLAGTGRAGSSGDGGPANKAELDHPTGMAIAGDGTVYVADTANNRIRRIAPDGVITTVAGSGRSGSTGDGGPAAVADLTEPQALALGPGGDLYVTDSGRVRRVGSNGTITTAVGGAGPLMVDGAAVSFLPNAIAVVGSGDLYVASASYKELLRVPPGGATSGVSNVSVAAGGLVATPDGGLVIADAGHFSIDYGNLRGGAGTRPLLTPIVTFTKGSIPGVDGTFRASGVAVGPDGRIFAVTDGANGGSAAPALIEILSDGSVQVLPTTACASRAGVCGAPTPQTPAAPAAGAHLGDGFCEPDLTNAGFGISAPPSGAAASHTKEAAIGKARVYAGNDSGVYDAYFASVRSPLAPKFGFGDAARPTWVVEASDVMPPARSTDPQLRGGATNPTGPYRMVAFVDDATFTAAGSWAACPAAAMGNQPVGAISSSGLDPGAVVRLDGIGPVRVGMTLEEAKNVAGGGVNTTHPLACPSLSYGDAGASITFTASDGQRIDAVTVAGAAFRTDHGVGIGNSVDDLTRAYGALTMHARVGARNGMPIIPGSEFFYLPGDAASAAYAVAFDVEAGIVRSIRAGRRQQVMADDPC